MKARSASVLVSVLSQSFEVVALIGRVRVLVVWCLVIAMELRRPLSPVMRSWTSTWPCARPYLVSTYRSAERSMRKMMMTDVRAMAGIHENSAQPPVMPTQVAGPIAS